MTVEEEVKASDEQDPAQDAPTQTIDDAMDMEAHDPNDPGDTSEFYMEVNDDSDSSMTTMMDVLQCLGVEPEVANCFYVSVLKQVRKQPRPTFVEVYGGGAIGEAATKLRNLNLQGLDAFDLRTRKPNGEFWDFDRQRDRREAK